MYFAPMQNFAYRGPFHTASGSGSNSNSPTNRTNQTTTAHTTTHNDDDYVLATEQGDDDDVNVNNKNNHQNQEKNMSSSSSSNRWNSNNIMSSIHTWSGQVVHDEAFQRFIVTLIIINTITMGLATFSFIRDNPTWCIRFETLDRIFLCIFTAELSLQFVWNGLALFHDGWLVFDFLVIAMSWAFEQAQVIRAFRVIRALRVITHIKELKDLVQALLSVFPRMAAIGMLLLLVFYIFAVMFTQLFHDLYQQGYTDLDYFSRLDITFFTLFQLLILDSWSDITRQCMQRYPWAWTIFITFTVISTFIVINLIIAVICNAVSVGPQDTTTEAEPKHDDPNKGGNEKDDIAKLHARMDEIYDLLKALQQREQLLVQNQTDS